MNARWLILGFHKNSGREWVQSRGASGKQRYRCAWNDLLTGTGTAQQHGVQQLILQLSMSSQAWPSRQWFHSTTPSRKDPAEEVSCTQTVIPSSPVEGDAVTSTGSLRHRSESSHTAHWVSCSRERERNILRQICHYMFVTWGYKLSCSAVQILAALGTYCVDTHTWPANPRWVLLDSSLFGLVLRWKQALRCSHWVFILEHEVHCGEHTCFIKA